MTNGSRHLLARRWLIFWLGFVATAIASGFLQIRPFDTRGERFMLVHDQADLAMVARNVAEGNGAVVDCRWLIHTGSSLAGILTGRPTALRHAPPFALGALLAVIQ